MLRHEILQRYPNASESFIRANLDPDDSRQAAVLERPPKHEPLAAHQGKKGTAAKLLVRFVSVRKRLLDPDNVSCKWTLDALRYAGIISGDEPEKITLEVNQRKAGKGEPEQTIIEIYEFPACPLVATNPPEVRRGQRGKTI
jgi:hypothetical protein